MGEKRQKPAYQNRVTGINSVYKNSADGGYPGPRRPSYSYNRPQRSGLPSGGSSDGPSVPTAPVKESPLTAADAIAFFLLFGAIAIPLTAMFALQGGTIEIIGIAAGVAWALGGALKPASLLASILGFIIAGFVVFRIPNWPSVDLYNTALNWTFLVQHILGMAVIAVAIQWIAVGILALRKW